MTPSGRLNGNRHLMGAESSTLQEQNAMLKDSVASV